MNHIWSPLEVTLLLEIHWSKAERLESVINSSQAFGNAIERFDLLGLIEPVNPAVLHNVISKTPWTGSEHPFLLTERGRSLVEMWCCTPLPQQVWVNPVTGKEIIYD